MEKQRAEQGNTSIKIGIITEYYNSHNYGGNLQAYALVKILSKYGEAEQIPYIQATRKKRTWANRIRGFQKNPQISQILDKIRASIVAKTIFKREVSKIPSREEAIRRFNLSIPHNNKNYNDDDIEKIVGIYDVFVVGSDQVWRHIENKAYFLGFVPQSKIKISYAASISKDSLTKEEREFFKEKLATFTAVSVREKLAVDLLKELAPVELEWVLDPTMLLNRCEWDEICSSKLEKKKYLFCYFLGDNLGYRKLATEYAKKNGLKLLTIPYLHCKYRNCDGKFGSQKNEEKLFDVSPADFISLIKYATMVFTDSFHAVVFSSIYEKEYFVFDRPMNITMSSRICSLLSLLKKEERFCNTAERINLDYVENQKEIDYTCKMEEYERLKIKSKEFLCENIRKC